MATEAQRATPSRGTKTAAPRFPAPEGSLAHSYEQELKRQNAAIEGLTSHKLDDVSVFGTEAEDLATDAASMAHSLCIVVGNALGTAEDRSSVHETRYLHLARAVDAIAHLISLSDLANRVAIREVRDGN